MKERPWLDYTGQTTAELLACKRSHRIDSLLCAFEEGIQAKGESGLGGEERLVLAVMALDREVNNGGYQQFFGNAPAFLPAIAASLRRIQCEKSAAITERALAALRLREDSARNEILTACSEEFYRLDEIGPKLLDFIEAHRDRIQLAKTSVPPRRPLEELSKASRLYAHLLVTKRRDLTLDGARRLARELARQNSIPAPEADLEGAAVLYCFCCALHAGDLPACEALAPRAFELMREETMHCVLHRDWVQQLVRVSRRDQADAAALAYLGYLKGCEQSTLSTQNRILFWAALLQKHRAALPKSVEFFVASFPDENLDEPLPVQRFVAKQRPAPGPPVQRRGPVR